MKEELSGTGVEFLAAKFKNNTNFDFSIASTFLNNVANSKHSNDSLLNNDISWKGIDSKVISIFFLFFKVYIMR